MDIKISSYDELPEWVDKNNDVSNNGSGKEYAGYLIIEDGDYKAVYNDAMEPEDARLYRDLNWVSKEIKRAYESGFKKGKETFLLDSDIKQIQIDALKWANEQILIDGNPELAKKRILDKIDKIILE